MTVIVSGHSLFFRTLFQAFMPHASDHEAKRKKVSNGGGKLCVWVRVASQEFRQSRGQSPVWVPIGTHVPTRLRM